MQQNQALNRHNKISNLTLNEKQIKEKSCGFIVVEVLGVLVS
jgi:hypothetical protein